jgi:[acyl-carrier-protein] S-malonyltransferase
MMADLAAVSPAAKAVLDQADAVLGMPLRELCFTGPQERLNATDISQPAIFACSAAALAAMHETLGAKTPTPAMMAGLSLGEYSALFAAGAIDFEPALKLVALRGKLMQESAQAHPSGMVSVMGLDEAKVLELCQEAAQGAVLTPANFNAPGQIVISGDLAACGRAVEIAPKFGASGAVALKVAGAFHSAFMQPAADKLGQAIAAVEFRVPKWLVVSNVDAAPHGQPESIKAKLIRQVTQPVRWEQSVRHMIAAGVTEFIEIGPGRVLTGLMRRIDRNAKARSIGSADALAKFAGELAL